MPDLTGEDLKGVPFKLSDFRGKVVLLHFWAHWSAPRVGMFPHERSLVQRFAGRPFALVGVNGDEPDAELGAEEHGAAGMLAVVQEPARGRPEVDR
ncbi:MAG TPA: TlpA disulfide reductase family protein [Pirellulales bacterium]|nr:TlpA disulfide reductase family protein [Pirellulales bacterium]